MDPWLAMVVAVTFPIIVVLTLLFQAKARKAYRMIRTRIAALNAFLSESISGVRVVQIFCAEAKSLAKFSLANKAVYDANIRQLYVYAVFRPLIDFMRWLAIAGVIYFGARFLIEDRISYGLLVMFLAYIGNFFEPISDLAEKFDVLQSAAAAGEKILSVFNADAVKELDIPATTYEARTSQSRTTTPSPNSSLPILPSPLDTPLIVFDNVWFAYKPDQWVLKGVSFEVAPRTTLAIVGSTGAGKSTIINLLTKLYRISKGAILLDGKEIAAISYADLRGSVAVVMQESFLFARSIRDNIILDHPYNETRFRDVCHRARLDSFLSRRPKADLEEVAEGGVTFSAGERQLLSFARALYADPAILVLDEATAHVDTETERLIAEATAELLAGRTSIVIAHRLSTIRSANRIIVLDEGEIAESGTHFELIEKKGFYYNLHSLQFSA
jgi:ABC-type multidrug transport system fused ATPase/permease subunit